MKRTVISEATAQMEVRAPVFTVNTISLVIIVSVLSISIINFCYLQFHLHSRLEARSAVMEYPAKDGSDEDIPGSCECIYSEGNSF